MFSYVITAITIIITNIYMMHKGHKKKYAAIWNECKAEIKTFKTETLSTGDLFNLYMEQFTVYTKIIRKQIKVALGGLSSLADEEVSQLLIGNIKTC